MIFVVFTHFSTDFDLKVFNGADRKLCRMQSRKTLSIFQKGGGDKPWIGNKLWKPSNVTWNTFVSTKKPQLVLFVALDAINPALVHLPLCPSHFSPPWITMLAEMDETSSCTLPHAICSSCPSPGAPPPDRPTAHIESVQNDSPRDHLESISERVSSWDTIALSVTIYALWARVTLRGCTREKWKAAVLWRQSTLERVVIQEQPLAKVHGGQDQEEKILCNIRYKSEWLKGIMQTAKAGPVLEGRGWTVQRKVVRLEQQPYKKQEWDIHYCRVVQGNERPSDDETNLPNYVSHGQNLRKFSPRTGQKSGILTSNPTFWPSTADGSNYQEGLATKGSVRTTMSHPKPHYKLNEILHVIGLILLSYAAVEGTCSLRPPLFQCGGRDLSMLVLGQCLSNYARRVTSDAKMPNDSLPVSRRECESTIKSGGLPWRMPSAEFEAEWLQTDMHNLIKRVTRNTTQQSLHSEAQAAEAVPTAGGRRQHSWVSAQWVAVCRPLPPSTSATDFYTGPPVPL
ncbi:hypothetical protein B0H19DRAFT_1083878 [Mycena capillaripes]|nr:hypothetical protein B0H19DRAFT_1083878 [Mycena capillaripes]